MSQGRTIRRWILAALLVAAAPLSALAQRSDMELLREARFAPAAEDKAHPYGIEPGRQTLSPIYHLTSSTLWLWENLIAPDVCAPGGYTDTNTHYFKSLTLEYGSLGAFFLGFDRAVRNTRIGRVSTPKNERGLIEDDPKRYRQ